MVIGTQSITKHIVRAGIPSQTITFFAYVLRSGLAMGTHTT